jgi:hypothetical protein
MCNVNVRFYNPHTRFEPVECSLPARPNLGDKIELPGRLAGVVAEIMWKLISPPGQGWVWQVDVRLDRLSPWDDVFKPRMSTERG